MLEIGHRILARQASRNAARPARTAPRPTPPAPDGSADDEKNIRRRFWRYVAWVIIAGGCIAGGAMLLLAFPGISTALTYGLLGLIFGVISLTVATGNAHSWTRRYAHRRPRPALQASQVGAMIATAISFPGVLIAGLLLRTPQQPASPLLFLVVPTMLLVWAIFTFVRAYQLYSTIPSSVTQ